VSDIPREQNPREENEMVIFCRILGGVLAAAGVCWFFYWFAEQFDTQPLVPSAAQIGLAVAGVFLGLLIVGFGELYRKIAEVEVNTRKPV
jgi:hypothetical protein